MVIQVFEVMARRRKFSGGSKASKLSGRATRKVNGISEEKSNGSVVRPVIAESEESCLSQDENLLPLSCKTPVEMHPSDPNLGEPPPVAQYPIQSVPHKKFGKFRCLLENSDCHKVQVKCTLLGKVEETPAPGGSVEEAVLGQMSGGRAILGSETSEVVWEEQVVEETVVCEGMEIDLEEARSQDEGHSLEGDQSQVVDYNPVVEANSGQERERVLLQGGECVDEDMVDLSVPCNLQRSVLVKDSVSYERGQGTENCEEFIGNFMLVGTKEGDGNDDDGRMEACSQERLSAVNGTVSLERGNIETVVKTCMVNNTKVKHSTVMKASSAGEVLHCVTRSQREGNLLRNCEELTLENVLSNNSVLEVRHKRNARLRSADLVNDNCGGLRTSECNLSNSSLNPKRVKLMAEEERELLSDTVRTKVKGSASITGDSEVLRKEQRQDLQVTGETAKLGNEDAEKKQPSFVLRGRSGSTDTTGSESGSSVTGVRRSSRLRSIGLSKQRVRKKNESEPVQVNCGSLQDAGDSRVADSQDISESVCLEVVVNRDKVTPKVPVPLSSPMPIPFPSASSYEVDTSKPVKVKSRWRRSSELEMVGNRSSDSDMTTPPTPSISPRPVLALTPSLSPKSMALSMIPPSQVSLLSVSPAPQSELVEPSAVSDAKRDEDDEKKEKAEREREGRLQSFIPLFENEYLTHRSTSKEAKRMVCDCSLTKEEIMRGEMGCGEDCLNRLLMIECGSRCTVGESCTNKRFQRQEYAKCEIFKTEKKGFGLRTLCDLPAGAFVMEYVGEVVDQKEFRRRAKDYSKDKNKHFYFMALKSDAIIDATAKGNISRFINHSCDPNSETQKWTVNGELRIGFFSKIAIQAGEEITFDYQFQRYGKEAQRCYCETANCRGWIGEDPEKEKRDRKERKEREIKKKKEERRKDVKEFFDDMDMEEEIEKLVASGLKNRTHTLTLCRLMVRAEDRDCRIQLLKLIQGGEQACRRLFLDYHGLRLLWSWMMDVGSGMLNDDEILRIEIIKTLAELPIPNKTMLQDSKVMTVVEKWLGVTASVDICQEADKKDGLSQDEESGSDQDNSKPRGDDVLPSVEVPDEDTQQGLESEKQVVDGAPDLAPGDAIVLGRRGSISDEEEESNVDKKRMFTDMASRLLGVWNSLKEVFRIPKKERLEQMKEHEREADRGYKEYLDREGIPETKSYDRHPRFRNEEKRERKRTRESPDADGKRKGCRYEDRNLVPVPRMSKHERRQLFALKVAQEDEERRQQQEMWRQHEDQCMALGMDPAMTAAFDPQTGYPCFFDPTSGTWQSFPPQDSNTLAPPEMVPSPLFNPSSHHPHLSTLPNQNISSTLVTHMSVSPHSVPHGIPPPVAPAHGTPSHAIPSHGMPPPHTVSAVPPVPSIPSVPPIIQPIQPSQYDPNNPVTYDPSSLNVSGMQQPQQRHTPYVDPHPSSHESGSIPEIISIPLGPQPVYQQVPPSQHVYAPQQPVDTQGIPQPQYHQVHPVQHPYVHAVPPLPPKWKSARDAEGRVYYYHVKTRVSQWEPPQWSKVDQQLESESSSDTSEDDDDDDEEESSSTEEEEEGEQEEKVEDEEEEEEEEEGGEEKDYQDDDDLKATEMRGESAALSHQRTGVTVPEDGPSKSVVEEPRRKDRRREGLVQERIISPRREEDRTDNKKYKEIKEKLRRKKELLRAREHAERSKKRHRDSKQRSSSKNSEKPVTVAADTSSDAARKIKDQFRLQMAGVIVQYLNPYRKPDCKVGRINNTEDFKHLARKLTHFVMVKELKHCRSVEDLECNDNVKHKARDFVKKYMAKFGSVYQRPKDDD